MYAIRSYYAFFDWESFPCFLRMEGNAAEFLFPGGFRGTLTEISSRLNPNTDRKEFWTYPGLIV